MRHAGLATLGLLLLAGCAAASAPRTGSAPQVGSTPQAASATPAPARVERGNLNLITSAEIQAAGTDMLNAYDLVERLRPTMMRFRNQTGGTRSTGDVLGPVAYVDEQRLGALDLLRTVPRSSIREIRYLSASDATTRFGTGHSSGAIQVLTKR